MKIQTFTFAFMDPPYESMRTSTFFRILHQTLLSGHNVKVFAYEGAVSLTSTLQKRHANPIHGHDVVDEDHPLPSVWISELRTFAEDNGCLFSWINCGLCADERGVFTTDDEIQRGGPADFYEMLKQSNNALVIGTR